MLAGHVIWVTLRLGISAAVFLVIMALFGTLHSPWAVLCIPAAVLTGAAWVPGMFGYAATLETDSGFALVFRFLIMPMFLFSGTFFPISQLPDWLESVAVAHPAVARRRAVPRPRPRHARAAAVARARRLPVPVGRRRLLVGAAHLHPAAGLVTAPGTLRVAPPVVTRRLVGSGGARYLVERNVRVYRNEWLVLVSGFLEPVFYLFSIGVGVSQLVGDVELPGGQVVTYTAFVAPAMLAASAMNGAVIDATFGLFFKLKYNKLYDAVLATPVTPVDVAVGEITWALARGSLYSVAFIVMMLFMGLITSWWALLALPAGC